MTANQSEVLREAANAILENLRDRGLLKYLFHEKPEQAGPYGYIEAPIDLDTQREIATSLARIVLSQASESQSQPEMDEVALRNAFLEGLRSGWNSGRAGETMDDDYAERSWQASDAAALSSRAST